MKSTDTANNVRGKIARDMTRKSNKCNDERYSELVP